MASRGGRGGRGGSDYKVKTGALTNMSVRDLEERGAETGLVVELNDMDGLEKIEPNQMPSGLDRMSTKAQEYMKLISMVTDSMMGNDREDVAAKAITAKQGRSAAVHAKPLDNLARTDYLLTRSILDIVQEHYIQERVYNIVTDRLTGTTEEVAFNTFNEAGEIVNDLTLGEFHIIITTAPAREAFEDSQFEQAVQLRELLGDEVPSSVIVKNSRLLDRGEIITQMEARANSPEAQEQDRIALETAQAELDKLRAETGAKQADMQAKVAKAESALADMKRKLAETMHKIQTDTPEIRMAEAEQNREIKREEHAMDMQMQQEQHALDMQMKETEKAVTDARAAIDVDAHAQQTQLQLQTAEQQHGMQLRHAEENHQQSMKQQADKTKAAKKPAPKKPKE